MPPAPREPSARSRIIRFWALVVALWAAAAAVALGLDHWPGPAPYLHAPVWLVAGLFLLAQAFPMPVRDGQETRWVFLDQIPLVLGFFLLAGPRLVLAVGAAVFLRYVLARRLLDALFNAANMSLSTGLALGVFRLLDAPVQSPAAALPRVLVAATVHELASAGVVMLWSASQGRAFSGGRLGSALRSSAGPGLAAVVIGLALTLVAHTSLAVAALLGVVVVVALHGNRNLVKLRQHARDQERLVDLGQALLRLPAGSTELAALLEPVRLVAQAASASLHLRGPVEADVWRVAQVGLPVDRTDETELVAAVFASGQGVRRPRRFAHPLTRRGRVEDALAVPLQDAGQVVGVLMACRRLTEHEGFGVADLALLQAAAAPVQIALANRDLLAQIVHDQVHDGLTDLPNSRALRRQISSRTAATLLFVAVEDAEDLGSCFGPLVVDEVVLELSRRLTEAADLVEAPARLEGATFAALVIANRETCPLRQAEALRHRLELPVSLATARVDVRLSIGLASLVPGQDPESLIRQATAAAHAARNEPSRVVRYSAGLEAAATRRLAVVAELRRALLGGDNHGLTLAYQPQASLKTAQAVAVEALVRWHHPQLGPVTPVEFVPLAEQAGLIGELTRHVLHEGLGQLRSWREAGLDVTLAVNVSTRSLLETTFVGEVADALRQAGVPAGWLTLEVTESTVMEDEPRCLETLRQLRELGVRLSIDDFGTGYAALSYLDRLPVDEVKLDRSFLRDIRPGTRSGDVVGGVVQLAHTLGLVVVAEGVEDAATWRLLEALGVDLVQGYFLARPQPAADTTTWLRRHLPHRESAAPDPRRAD